jgi:muramoyltetrapeptide carboxypeptidase LdcA involved in peptidoglycan recycling
MEDDVKMNDMDKTEKKFSKKNDNVRVFNLNELLRDETVKNMLESILGDNADWRRM